MFTSADTIHSEPVRWLWHPRLPLRSLSVVAGEKGLGKSLLTNARLVAEATHGQLVGELHGQPIDVLICTAEDDWRSVVKPRLAAHGADLERVHRVSVSDDDGESLIDPVSAFLSGATDTHRDASVRRALAPVAALAERLDLVVVVVAHLTKDDSARLINRVSGSGAFVNAARSVLVLAPNPDDPDGEQGRERVLVHVRGDWARQAPTLALRIDDREVTLDDGSQTRIGYIEIVGETDINVQDLQRGRDEDAGTDVEEAIGAALVDGPRPSREVKANVATQIGCAKKTVERAAVRMAERSEILVSSGGYPRTTTWALNGGDTTSADGGDTARPPVGTPTDIRRVPTDDLQRSTVPTTPSRDSRDSRDGPPNRTVADLSDGQILAAFPGSTIEEQAV